MMLRRVPRLGRCRSSLVVPMIFWAALAPVDPAATMLLPLAAAAPEASTREETSVESLLSEVGELLVAERLEEAVASVEGALSGFEQAEDKRGQAVCLALLGMLDTEAIGSGEAVERLERALSLLVEVRHSFAAAAVARFLGRIHISNGRLERAETFLRRSLDLLQEYEGSGDPLPVMDYWVFASMLDLPSDLSMVSEPASAGTRHRLVRQAEGAIRDGLGSIATWSGRFDEAEIELDRALALLSSSETALRERTLQNLALLHQRQGRFEDARRIVEALLETASESHRRVKLFKLLEALELWSGDLAEALERNARALTRARERGDRLAVAMLLTSRGELHQESGDLARAGELFDRACKEASEAGDPYAEAHAQQDRGEHALRTGAYELAVSSLERAIPRFQTAGDREAELTSRLLLGGAYVGLGAHDRAAGAVRAAQKLARTMHFPAARDMAQAVEELTSRRSSQRPRGQDFAEMSRLLESPFEDPLIAPALGQAKATLLHALRLLGEGARPQDLLHLLQRALEQAEEEGDVRGQLQARIVLGHLYRLQGSSDRVRREWMTALELARRLNGRQIEAQVLGSLTELVWNEGQREEAVEYALASVEAFEETMAEVRTDTLLASFLGDNTEIYTRAISGLIETGRFREAFSYSERARARALVQLLGNRRLRARRGDDPELVDELEAVRRRLHELESREGATGSTARELDEARRRFEDLLVRSQVLAPGYAELVRVAPLDLETLQAEVLDAETTLVSFFLLGDRVVAWVIDREEVAFTVTELSRSDLDLPPCLSGEIVRRARRRGVERLGPCRSAMELSTEIYRKLMAPLMPFIRHERLVLIPHDALHRLPFAALQNPRTGRYLIEDYTLTTAPSASVLQVLRRQANPWRGKALVVGDPELPKGDLGPLPGARREAAAVAALFAAEPILEGEATETTIRRRSASADLVHLAAHGVYEPRHPLFSRIALAADEHHDGRLEMHEVFGELDLSEANLVVLSGCETALGERTGGDEVVGLVRAFLYAGSPAVLATLWSVHDHASAVLMEGFYRRLLAGAPAADALRQAQLETMRRNGTESPYYWAGFLLTGRPDPLGPAGVGTVGPEP